jgi:hypothetical protein
MNPFDEMRREVEQAKRLFQAIDSVTNDMARLLDGRLHSVSPSILKRLKKQLRDFNAHTGRWS